MKVEKRNGDFEEVSFDKILSRLNALCNDSHLSQLSIDASKVAQKVCSEIFDGVKTSELDILSSEVAISLYTQNIEYKELASRIVISNHHKNTLSSFSEITEILYNYVRHEKSDPLINENYYQRIMEHKDIINDKINDYLDYKFDYFGFNTLFKSYLLKVDGIPIERPQHMLMRVALSIHKTDLDLAFETYDYMSNRYFIHATPTLFNAGSNREQFSSCFLLMMSDDSVKGIYETLSDCAQISKYAGGIGLAIHNIRAKDSFIAGTNGISNGIVPMLRVFNDTARYIDQCISSDTYIYTTKGPKKIQNCNKKTKIFTTNGPEIIQNVLEHSYNGDILTIETMHSLDKLQITMEHPVLCLKNQKSGTNYEIIKHRLSKKIISPEWCEAKDITKDDLLMYKIPTYEIDNEDYTEDDCYLYGILLGDGCMNNKNTTTYISINAITKQNILEFVKRYLDNKCIQYDITQKDNTIRIRWNKNLQLPFRYNDLYDENNEKYIQEDWINLPVEKIKNIVKGLIDTDGCKHNELVFDTTSRKLVESLRYLLLRMGIPSSGYIRDRVGQNHISKYGDTIENKKISYCLRIPKTEEISALVGIEKGNFYKYFVYNEYIYTRIKNINKKEYSGTLYDLQMKDTHNYMIHNGIVHNGGGKRNGSFAIYLEPWHADIFDFLELKKNHGNEMERARDLFYGLWICDLFMKRVQNDEMWSLFCPDICPGLFEVHSDEFEKLYTQYESEKKYTKQVKAQELWFAILTSQIETGTPYLVYKDACNRKSNQQNLGTIKSSNLCTEIVEYTDKDETAVCNLASISLKSCLDYKNYSDYTIKIYSKPNCIYCIATENYCKRYNINYEKVPYTEITISTEKPHKVSFPQIYHKVGINYEYIGGYEDFIHFMKPEYNYERLKRITKVLVKNLNNIIDYNFYPTERTKRSNFNHRPIGIGIQGFANVLYEMKLSFDTDEAKELNKKIFETIYYGALEKSMEIAKERQKIIEYYKKMLDDLKNDRIILASSITERLELLNNYKKQHNILEEEYLRTDYLGTYSTYIGSPMYKGKLQHDLWNHEVDNSLHDWTELRENIKLYGIRNSLLLAPMPTASTSQILGNYECFEPVMSNIYTRRVLSGEFLVLNDYLIEELRLFNLWDNTMKEKLIGNDGSVQMIESIPDYIKKIYKTAWELKQKHIIDMAADRGKFICQSQSLNLFMEAPNFSKLSSMHFYAWKKGLKTGMYYLRSRPSSKAIQFTLSPEVCDTCSA